MGLHRLRHGSIDDGRAGRGRLHQAQRGEEVGIGHQDRREQAGGRCGAHERHGHDRHRHFPAHRLQVGRRCTRVDDERRHRAQDIRERLLPADVLPAAKRRSQGSQAAAGPFDALHGILDVLGAVVEQGAPVLHVACRRLGDAAFDHVPVDADLVQGVDESGGGQPIVQRAGSEVRRSRAPTRRRHRHPPPASTRRRSSQGSSRGGVLPTGNAAAPACSNCSTRDGGKRTRSVIGSHVRAGSAQDAAGALGHDADAGLLEQAQTALVDLRAVFCLIRPGCEVCTLVPPRRRTPCLRPPGCV